jgi:hypothetical protein
MAFHWSPLCDRQGKPSFAVFPRFSKSGQDGISKSTRDSGFFFYSFFSFPFLLLFASSDYCKHHHIESCSIRQLASVGQQT